MIYSNIQTLIQNVRLLKELNHKVNNYFKDEINDTDDFIILVTYLFNNLDDFGIDFISSGEIIHSIEKQHFDNLNEQDFKNKVLSYCKDYFISFVIRSTDSDFENIEFLRLNYIPNIFNHI